MQNNPYESIACQLIQTDRDTWNHILYPYFETFTTHLTEVRSY